jgi:hypothetical protein
LLLPLLLPLLLLLFSLPTLFLFQQRESNGFHDHEIL